jgi:hypothetical protein
MNYATCVAECAVEERSRGCARYADLYESYPVPGPAEWAQCLLEVDLAGEDRKNPYHCMGAYELRLSRRGIETVLGCLAEDLRAIASRTGIPSRFFVDAVRCLDISNVPSDRSEKSFQGK